MYQEDSKSSSDLSKNMLQLLQVRYKLFIVYFNKLRAFMNIFEVMLLGRLSKVLDVRKKHF